MPNANNKHKIPFFCSRGKKNYFRRYKSGSFGTQGFFGGHSDDEKHVFFVVASVVSLDHAETLYSDAATSAALNATNIYKYLNILLPIYKYHQMVYFLLIN